MNNDRPSAEDLVTALRTADLPRAVRGLDERTTRQLLEEAALSVETLSTDNAGLREAASRLQATIAEQQVALAEQVELEATIQRALLAAARSAEEILAEARREANDVLGEARREANDLLENARRAANDLLEETQRAANGQIAEATDEAEKLVEDARGAFERERQRLEDDWRQLEQDRDGVLEKARRAAEEVEQLAARELERVHGQAQVLLADVSGFHTTLVVFCTQAEQMLAEHRTPDADGGEARPPSHQDPLPLEELGPTRPDATPDAPAGDGNVLDEMPYTS